MLIGPVRDYWAATKVFPEWGGYGPGIAPVLAISAGYVLLGIVGHGVSAWSPVLPRQIVWRADRGSHANPPPFEHRRTFVVVGGLTLAVGSVRLVAKAVPAR
jgi:hypothetical protein